MNRLFTVFVISTLTLTGLASVGIQSVQAQNFRVIYPFAAGTDEYSPHSGLTLDSAGNLYGTTTQGGYGPGSVFQLKRTNGNWTLKTLGFIGSSPSGKVVWGPGGSLYGTTNQGGSGGCQFGCGTVYNLRSACVTGNCSWMVAVLHSFRQDRFADDGWSPGDVDPVFDHAGNLYGTTQIGGPGGNGTVFKLTPSGDGWMESIIHSFTEGDGGYNPVSGVIFDSAGNLYGTTAVGGINGDGTVYRLAPSGSGWVLSTLYDFLGGEDGLGPTGGLIFDRSGNLYGTTSAGGCFDGGSVFKLSPVGGSWTFSLLHCWSGNGEGPTGDLAMDAAGNLYGAITSDLAYQYGSVFKLTPTGIYTDLHAFTGLDDGAYPDGGVTLDVNGNLYGTTLGGGPRGGGVVWEIAP